MSLPHSGDERKTNLDPDRRAERSDDCCAVLTGTGRSAIAVIGLWGTNAAVILGRCFDPATKAELSAGQIRYGDWTGPEQQESPAESVVVTPIRTAATDPQSFEIQCHGGAAAIERIVGDLQACGAKRVEAVVAFPVENLLIREARSTLSNCLTERIAAIALDQVRGVLADWATRWIDVIDSMLPGDDSNALSGLCQEAQSILDRAPIGIRLAEPFRVVLVGPPNVGKSSLVNAIVGYDRSITFDEAGTTRDVLHADTVIDGIPVRLSDTAGIRASEETIEREGVAKALAAAESADLVLVVTSAEAPASGQTDDAAMPAAVAGRFPMTLQVLNKRDLIPAGEFPPRVAIAANALTGEGISELLQAIADRLGRILPPPGQPVPLNRRQADRIGELTRVTDSNQTKSILQRLIGVPE